MAESPSRASSSAAATSGHLPRDSPLDSLILQFLRLIEQVAANIEEDVSGGAEEEANGDREGEVLRSNLENRSVLQRIDDGIRLLQRIRQRPLGRFRSLMTRLILHDLARTLSLQVPEPNDDYIRNREENYVDEGGYQALLQNLAEIDAGKRGAPPAAKSVVAELPSVEIQPTEEIPMCAVCKETVNVSERVTKLPCNHVYHRDCILPWLESRNSCPVCRFELPTDDMEYEEERNKRRRFV